MTLAPRFCGSHLLQLSLGDLDLDRLVNLLGMAPAVVGVVFDRGREQSVYEGGLAQSGLTGDHDSESRTALGHDLVTLVGELPEGLVLIALSL